MRSALPAPTSSGSSSPSSETALRGRPVLVTGASGFLGRHLSRHLHAAGAEVHGVSRTARRRPSGAVRVWHHGDPADAADADALADLVARIRPAAVFHLAGHVEGRRDSDLVLPMLEANTRAAVAVMTAARAVPGCRVVLAGSVEEPRGDDAPCSPYAAAKAAATGYARLFHAQWDVPVTVLRIAMVYGPDQPDRRKLVPHVAGSLLDGVAPALASGARPIDWVYVDDVCDAFLRAANRPEAAGAVVDIGSGRTATVAEVVTHLARLAGYDGDLGFGALEDRRHDVARVADPRPAAEVLGWRPATSLGDGLARTLAWHDRERGRGERHPLGRAV